MGRCVDESLNQAAHKHSELDLLCGPCERLGVRMDAASGEQQAGSKNLVAPCRLAELDYSPTNSASKLPALRISQAANVL